jgi:hypothetical protein
MQVLEKMKVVFIIYHRWPLLMVGSRMDEKYLDYPTIICCWLHHIPSATQSEEIVWVEFFAKPADCYMDTW